MYNKHEWALLPSDLHAYTYVSQPLRYVRTAPPRTLTTEVLEADFDACGLKVDLVPVFEYATPAALLAGDAPVWVAVFTAQGQAVAAIQTSVHQPQPRYRRYTFPTPWRVCTVVLDRLRLLRLQSPGHLAAAVRTQDLARWHRLDSRLLVDPAVDARPWFQCAPQLVQAGEVAVTALLRVTEHRLATLPQVGTTFASTQAGFGVMCALAIAWVVQFTGEAKEKYTRQERDVLRDRLMAVTREAFATQLGDHSRSIVTGEVEAYLAVPGRDRLQLLPGEFAPRPVDWPVSSGHEDVGPQSLVYRLRVPEYLHYFTKNTAYRHWPMQKGWLYVPTTAWPKLVNMVYREKYLDFLYTYVRRLAIGYELEDDRDGAVWFPELDPLFATYRRLEVRLGLDLPGVQRYDLDRLFAGCEPTADVNLQLLPRCLQTLARPLFTPGAHLQYEARRELTVNLQNLGVPIASWTAFVQRRYRRNGVAAPIVTKVAKELEALYKSNSTKPVLQKRCRIVYMRNMKMAPTEVPLCPFDYTNYTCCLREGVPDLEDTVAPPPLSHMHPARAIAWRLHAVANVAGLRP
jgi:hypothetical protein